MQHETQNRHQAKRSYISSGVGCSISLHSTVHSRSLQMFLLFTCKNFRLLFLFIGHPLDSLLTRRKSLSMLIYSETFSSFVPKFQDKSLKNLYWKQIRFYFIRDLGTLKASPISLIHEILREGTPLPKYIRKKVIQTHLPRRSMFKLLKVDANSREAKKDFIISHAIELRNNDCEEDDEVIKELYDDVNVKLGNDDTEMTVADQGASEQQNVSQESGIPNFTSVFKFEQRVSALESEMSELRQTNQFAEAISSILGIVDSTMKTIIKDQVKAQVSTIMPKIEKYVIESLGAEVLVRSTNQPQMAYASVHAEEPSHTVEDSGMQQDQEFVMGDNDEQPADKEVTKVDWFKKLERPPTPDPDWSKR
ncbi:hypothetical protein Tco_0772276 [Tanacetum coccineum]|uniref:Uncharacterized protein n=1 Tax=Tanacetum coccineum TaxID=301880 RepID=A0ABQ4ZHQ1_9ASTR